MDLVSNLSVVVSCPQNSILRIPKLPGKMTWDQFHKEWFVPKIEIQSLFLHFTPNFVSKTLNVWKLALKLNAFLLFLFLGFVCFSSRTSPPRCPICLVPCVPSNTLSSPRLRGWPVEWALTHLLPLEHASAARCPELTNNLGILDIGTLIESPQGS